MMKKYFSETLQYHEKSLLFQAHSHHCWPNAAFTGMQHYQEIVQKKLDDKWEYIFQTLVPRSQKILAQLLGWQNADNISLGCNTQELLIRLLSCFSSHHPIHILTTNHEYHSARRLFQSLAQTTLIRLHVLEGSYVDINRELVHALKEYPIDVCFFSQSFFRTGYTLDEKNIVNIAKLFPNTFFVVDTYHSLAARDLNFSGGLHNIALLGGGYKYLMSGEGCCYLALHPDAQLPEPLLNGWMAEFSSLSAEASSVLSSPSKTQGHYRFMGATFDPIGLFRLCSVWDFFEKENVTPLLIKSHVKGLHACFLQLIDSRYRQSLCLYHESEQGNFLSLKFKDNNSALSFVKMLKQRLVFTDSRDQFVRFGFGLYHDQEDVLELVCILNSLLANAELMLELPS